jgi:acyl-CoA reductase-like NAD-dependent aldehyde dehydrogenase
MNLKHPGYRQVGAITPWNYPQILAMSKPAPALAAGCTIVLKPSPETALDSYILGDAALEAGLPPGVLNIVLAGREVGSTLVRTAAGSSNPPCSPTCATPTSWPARKSSARSSR